VSVQLPLPFVPSPPGAPRIYTYQPSTTEQLRAVTASIAPSVPPSQPRRARATSPRRRALPWQLRCAQGVLDAIANSPAVCTRSGRPLYYLTTRAET
jgi:hypothetical protein